MHHCEDLVEAMVSSERSIYKTGDTLLVKSVSLPKPAGVTDDVYVDEVAFLTTPTSVTQMYPPALKQKGILIEDVAVKKVTENGYSLEFQTTNCKTGMPLLGLLQVEGPPASFDTQVTVTRSSQTATGPLAGTWDLGIQGQVVKDIPAGVDPKVLEGILESALGTDLTVQYCCKNYHYYIEWEEDPGRKELVEIHTDNLMFDGRGAAAHPHPEWHGHHCHPAHLHCSTVGQLAFSGTQHAAGWLGTAPLPHHLHGASHRGCTQHHGGQHWWTVFSHCDWHWLPRQ
ncbi:uncharacterized protein LOC135097968 isoform X1 [Scylla paramamosain]|uniref:uncharacterized protein LOC135097968 isoform X1 n=1 Tax=Scylla paramamosain TaxID=85552 RepID=UPI0030827DF9